MTDKKPSASRDPAKNAILNPELSLIIRNPMPQHPLFRVEILAFLFLSTLLVDGAFCRPVNAGDNYSVAIAPLQDQERKKYRLKMIQPYAFNLKTIQKFMQSLAYQERDVSWSAKKRVFSSRDVQALAPEIKKQFTQAGKNHRVTYKIKNSKGKTLLKGDTFLTNSGMNWRITTLKRSTRKTGDFSIMGDTWRLVPLTGQNYKTHERHKNLVQDLTNWVLFARFHPNQKRVLKEPAPQDAKGSHSPAKVKERLKVLDELKQEELITEEEYRKKRREILNSL